MGAKGVEQGLLAKHHHVGVGPEISPASPQPVTCFITEYPGAPALRMAMQSRSISRSLTKKSMRFIGSAGRNEALN